MPDKDTWQDLQGLLSRVKLKGPVYIALYTCTAGIGLWRFLYPRVWLLLEARLTDTTNQQSLLHITASLSIGISSLLAYLLAYKIQNRTPLTIRYPFDTSNGWHTHPETGHRLCSKCLADGTVIQLTHTDPPANTRMCCPRCGQTYPRRYSAPCGVIFP